MNLRFRTLFSSLTPCLSGFVFVQNRLEFYLDPDADHYGNILEMAEGFWYIDDKPTDR